MKKKFLTKSETETLLLGESLSKHLSKGSLVLLYGDLGAGKTVFVKGVCKGLEVPENTYITSPTFSIVNVYEGKYKVYHVDLYRLDYVDEAEIGLWEYLEDGVVIIEWADRLGGIKAESYLKVEIFYINDNSRKIVISGYGELQELPAKLDKDNL